MLRPTRTATETGAIRNTCFVFLRDGAEDLDLAGGQVCLRAGDARDDPLGEVGGQDRLAARGTGHGVVGHDG